MDVEITPNRVLDARNWNENLVPGTGNYAPGHKFNFGPDELREKLAQLGNEDLAGYYAPMTERGATMVGPGHMAMDRVIQPGALAREYALRQEALQAVLGRDVWPNILEPVEFRGGMPIYPPELMDRYRAAREALGMGGRADRMMTRATDDRLLERTIDPNLALSMNDVDRRGDIFRQPISGSVVAPDLAFHLEQMAANPFRSELGSALRHRMAKGRPEAKAFRQRLKEADPLMEALRSQGYDAILRNPGATSFLGDPHAIQVLDPSIIRAHQFEWTPEDLLR
jgi:hypothetical protein